MTAPVAEIRRDARAPMGSARMGFPNFVSRHRMSINGVPMCGSTLPSRKRTAV